MMRSGIPLAHGNPPRPVTSWLERLRLRLGLARPSSLPDYTAPLPLSATERSVKILQLEKYLRSHGGLRLGAAWIIDLSSELNRARHENAEMEGVLHFKREWQAYLLKHPEVKNHEAFK